RGGKRTAPTGAGTATTRRRRKAGSRRLLRPAFFWPGRARLVTIHFKVWTRSSRHRVPRGAIAQLGERLNGIQEVRGSTPLGSTNNPLITAKFQTKGVTGGRSDRAW